MLIHWLIKERIDNSFITFLQRVADAAQEHEGITFPCSVSVCMCNDKMIQEINTEYRKIEKSTDVLSFPSISFSPDKTAGLSQELVRQEYDDETGTCFLGDIFISVPHAEKQAEEFGHSLFREISYLLAHGLCHLFGYDHIKTEDKNKMRKAEEDILMKASSIIENSLEQKLLQLARKGMGNSYSPYSGFPVGAALHSIDGKIFTGCNVENASFGLCNCAERTAVFKAISEGSLEFDMIAIAATKKAYPCGACRQVLSEFSPNIRILVTWDQNVEEKKLNELLPESFGPHSLYERVISPEVAEG